MRITDKSIVLPILHFNCLRRYGSVEKLAKQVYGEHYIPVAPDWEFKQFFLDEFSRAETTREINLNSFATIRSQAILTLQEKLWPVVYTNSVRFFAYYIVLESKKDIFLTFQFPSLDRALPSGGSPYRGRNYAHS